MAGVKRIEGRTEGGADKVSDHRARGGAQASEIRDELRQRSSKLARIAAAATHGRCAKEVLLSNSLSCPPAL